MNTKVGIVGGGQLGRMLVEAANRLNVQTIILDKEGSPAMQIKSGPHVVGNINDAVSTSKLASVADIITVEIEHVNVDALEALELNGKVVQPTCETLRLIQNKYIQKQYLDDNGILVGEFEDVGVDKLNDAIRIGESFGYPFMLKAKTLAYDGRGNFLVKSESDLPKALDFLGNVEVYAEKFVPYKKELAVMVAKSLSGELISYPCVETIQENNICHMVIAPAQIDGLLAQKAIQLAQEAVSTLTGAGIFGVEMFLCGDGSLLINEIAPRPHNSGHYSIEACDTSQFEQHLRCILGLPFGSTRMKVPAAVMINLIGQGSEDTFKPCFNSLMVPGATTHLYGKSEDRVGRKMGHITFVGNDLSEVYRVAQHSLSSTKMEFQGAFPLVGVIMGSDTDLPIVKNAAVILKSFGVPFEMEIVSAHRTPDRMSEYAKNAHKRGIKVIIAAAGGAAHLPGFDGLYRNGCSYIASSCYRDTNCLEGS
jgi:phosphoribosylaminoimidazole carboxylase